MVVLEVAGPAGGYLVTVVGAGLRFAPSRSSPAARGLLRSLKVGLLTFLELVKV